MAKKRSVFIDQHVGARMRARRLMLGMSRQDLAQRLRLTVEQIQDYEMGTNRIGASRLQQIAGILQVPVSFFFQDIAATDAKLSVVD